MKDDEKMVFIGTSASAKTMADGTLRLAIDISPQEAVDAFTAFGVPGSAVALARLTDSAALDYDRPGRAVKGEYGQLAKILVQSGFFRTPAVWEAIGTDEQYLAWVKRQPCYVTGKFSEFDPHTGDGFSIPAHVRRVSEGAGTAAKPPYCAIPLCDRLHKLQHDQGESAVMPQERWEKARIEYVQKWARETLKATLGYESWTNVDPVDFLAWAQEHDVIEHLPRSYESQAESET